MSYTKSAHLIVKISNCVGVMICYILGAWLDWSQLALVSATLPIPFLAIMFTVPETPRSPLHCFNPLHEYTRL